MHAAWPAGAKVPGLHGSGPVAAAVSGHANPAGQGVHATVSAPPYEYVPAAHFAGGEIDASAHWWPAGHTVQLLAPAGAVNPGGHATAGAAGSGHAVPAAHVAQAPPPSAARVPTAQRTGAPGVCGSHAWPAGHARHGVLALRA